MHVGENPMSKTFLKPKKALSFYVIPKQQNKGIQIPFCRMLIADFSNHLNFIGSINANTKLQRPRLKAVETMNRWRKRKEVIKNRQTHGMDLKFFQKERKR